MRNRLWTALLAVSIIGWSSHALAATEFIVDLDGNQEVPPVASAGSGAGTMTLVDLGGGQFRWDWSLTISSHFNFSTVTGNAALNNEGTQVVTGMHIHYPGPRGVNAGVVYGVYGPSHDRNDSVMAVLNPDNSTTITGDWGPTDGSTAGNLNTFAPILLASMPGDDVPFYWNVHTTAHTGGEIRGQIVAIPEPATLGLLGLTLLGLRRSRR